jgi:heme/copper-type cytochrome/quinol oxidase subunit 4
VLANLPSMTAADPSQPDPGRLAPEIREWLSQNFDHTMSRQRSQADTAKLLVTFALGIAATLVATALQVGDPNGWDLTATIILGVAFIFALLVIVLDRVKEPNRRWLMDRLARKNMPPDEILDALAQLEGDCHEENDTIVFALRGLDPVPWTR